MKYWELQPGPAVRSFVKCYWLLEDPAPTDHVQRIVPDGRPELVFNLGRPFQALSNGRWKVQPECFFVGQITGPMQLRPSGPARTLGVRFHPDGVQRLLGVPAYQLTGEIVPLDAIAKKMYREFGWLRDQPALPTTSDQLDEVLLSAATTLGRNDEVVSLALRDFETAGGLISVSGEARKLGLSTRQLQRRFLSAVGISPKLFCRMQRFQRVFQAAGVAGSPWADVALRHGYYDQAHMVQDFHEFAGNAPTALLAGEIDLARQFALSSSSSSDHVAFFQD